MERKTQRLHSSAPLVSSLELGDHKHGLKKKTIVVNSFINSNINIQEMITYFKHRKHKKKRNIEIIKP